MRPRLIHLLRDAGLPWLGPLVPGYVGMLVVAALVGGVYLVRRAPGYGISQRKALDIAAWSYLAGVAGGVLLPLLLMGVDWLTGATPHYRGLTAYGGLLAGVAMAILLRRRAGAPVWPLLDLAAPSVALGIFFTRMGCFLAGCDYGKVTDVPWAVRFPRGAPAFRDHAQYALVGPHSALSLPVHPTQIYHSLSGLALFVTLVALEKRLKPRPGALFLVLAGGYAVLRFGIELYRGDAGRGFAGPLSTSQLISLGVLPAVLIAARRRAAGMPGTTQPGPRS